MTTLSRPSPCPPYFRKTLAAACLLAMLQSAQAVTFPVTTEAELRQAILSANANPGTNVIDIRANILITGGDLPPILNALTLRGNNHSIDGGSAHRLLVIGASDDAGGPKIKVQVTNLVLTGGLAAGGAGGNGGGGGLGGGGAVLVNSRADVVFSNVSVLNSSAAGGSGAAGLGGGGGGVAGAGGSGVAAGGGGLYGDGGAGAASAGGGGGLGGAGGSGSSGPGGGGGYSGDGGAGTVGDAGSESLFWNTSSAGSGSSGTAGGSNGGGGGSAAAGGSAGGGGFAGATAAGNGGDGGLGGGGGGSDAGNGGDGGFAGGGGGSLTGTGGTGGYGAGGGGSGLGDAGDGGFGGGGGSSVAASGGDGGLGGGGGSGATAGGQGGVAGGAGGTTGGGGGGALGGGILVAEGGSLSISGGGSYDGNAVVAGSGAGDGADGTARGNGIFLQGSGNLTVRVNAGQTLALNDDISDAVGSGLLPVSSFQQWALSIEGGGPVPVDVSNPAAGVNYGTVVLGGNNTIAGNITISGANALINSLAALGSGGVVGLDDGGLILADGLDVTQDLELDSAGGRIGVASGSAQLSNTIAGSGSMAKIGAGNLVLNGSSSHDGEWRIAEGGLVLDADSRLGNAVLRLDGGSIVYGAEFDDLRSINVTARGGRIDNNSFDVTIASAINNWSDGSTLTFTGSGTTVLSGAAPDGGNTVVAGTGRLEGRIGTGDLIVEQDATYALGGNNQRVGSLSGSGQLELGGNRLSITMNVKDPDAAQPDGNFGGLISGTGGLTINRTGLPGTFNPLTDIDQYRVQSLAAGNTYSGGTLVGTGAILAIADDSSIGTGGLTLAGGVLTTSQTSSNINITLAGSGGIFGELQYNGVISGVGTFVKYGPGTLTLSTANTYVGNTLVVGAGSYLALAHPAALGLGSLQLSLGGGLKILTDTPNLRPIQILNGVGVVDTGAFNVQSSGGISGLAPDSSLRKEGSGRMLVTGNINTPGGVSVAGGVLQVGNGGATGSISGDVTIGDGAGLEINRDGNLTLDGNITGNGSLLLSGPGTVTLAPDDANTFLGGLMVSNGLVAAASERALGFGEVTLDNGGLLLLGDIDRDITLGAAGGRLAVAAGNSFILDGDLLGSGNLTKTDAGTLVYTGIAGQNGVTTVAGGTLQIGSGLKGALVGNVDVNAGAALVFGRDDLTLYAGVIDGTGNVIKRGAGELVLTGEQLFDGVFSVESGNLRVGLGGTAGSLSGDVELFTGTRLIFDRSDDTTFGGGTSNGDAGAGGKVLKSGSGLLTVLGDLAHSGGTQINAGALVIGNYDAADISATSGLAGSISGAVSTGLGAQLVLNRRDDLTLAGDISGAGMIVQRGAGTTTLTGNNSQTGGVTIENGRLAIDSDARLGDASGKLIIKGGGILKYLANFDLRDLHLEPSGGGLDTGGDDDAGLDINYTGLISGSGDFIKQGLGRLTVTRLLLEGDLQVMAGDLRLGNGLDGGSSSASLSNATIASGAMLSLNRRGSVNMEGSLTGAGELHQVGSGELRLPGDSSLFTGTTFIDNGRLRLDGTLGGNLEIAGGTSMQGTGTLLGDLAIASGGKLTPGNSIGTLTVGSLTLNAGGTLEIEVDAAGASDRINVTGNAALAGILRVLPQPGDYTAPGCCTYTIISASTVSGTFDAVNNDLIFLDTSVNYLPGQVDVSFVRSNVGFNTVSLTENQQQVSSALDAMAAADPASPLPQLLTPLTADAARAAFDALSGDTLLGSVNASARVARRFNHLLSARSSRLGLASRGGSTEPMENSLAAVRAGNMPVAPAAFTRTPAAGIDPHHYDGPTSKVEGLWVEANAFSLTEDAEDTVGSAASTFDGQLLALGADGYWGNNLILGFGAGYVQGDMGFDNRQAEGSATGAFLGSYGRWETGSGWHYKAALTLGQQSTDQTRNGRVGGTALKAASSVDVTSASAEFEAGLALHVGNYGLRPYALLDVQYLQRDAIRETGASAANLNVDATTDVLGEFGVGAEISRPWLTDGARWAQIVGGIALMQPFGDTQREQTVRFNGSSNAFTVKATPDDSAALQLTLGGEWYLSKSVAVWGGYEGRVSSSTQEHNGVLSVQYRW